MSSSAQATSPAEKMLELDRPLVIAHRGYPTVAPENSIVGFRLANLAGADLVELDYHVDRDGEGIVIHDKTLDRTTDVTAAWGETDAKVVEKSRAEMQTLDAGTWYDPMFAGVRLPTLEEAIDAIQEGGMTLVERKAGSAEHIVALLKERDLVNEVIVQSFDWEYVTAVHEMLPEQVLGAIGPSRVWNGKKLSKKERELSREWIDEAAKTGARVLVWNAQVTPETISYAHDKGFKLYIYTINELEPAKRLLEAGVDGVITNNTAILWKAMASVHGAD
ncbi:MAG: glycerophosphodiester phosphodiesterase [Puniceicoccaceae bacterium]